LRLIIGISGATGSIYGIRTLEVLNELGIESHLVTTEVAKKNIEMETPYKVQQVEELATEVHHVCNMAASISSGSYHTDGMVIAPCSIKSLSGVANSFNHNLLIRAADVALKEKRKLVMVVRETPLHMGHLQLMVRVSEMGGVIMPPMPAFYHRPQTIDDLINQTVGKVLDQFQIKHNLFNRWHGV